MGYLLAYFEARTDYIVPRLMAQLVRDGLAHREAATIALGRMGPEAKVALPMLETLLLEAPDSLRPLLQDAIPRIRKEPGA